ncbi:MAG: YbdK family carboxylate-amine ligase [Propionibacteriaceae bacterium]|jgi:carboxylate-amine ligase|nr:YbdK family carboxylate-amine ligase [Propionibacteriaceae bacterium]
MEVVFNKSPQSTVGIEWELNLVDLDTFELTPAAGPLLEAVGGGEGKPVRQEYQQCMIEIVSEPRETIAEAAADLDKQLQRLIEAGAAMNVGIMGGGSHPFSHPEAQHPFRKERYDTVTERNKYWARQMVICGSHVHIGVAKQEHVLDVTWTMARFYPYLLALSCSSPFWDGVDSGFASQRTMFFQQLPTNGLPFRFETWEQFEAYVDDLVASEMISEVNELRWDVRPSPKFGTVENRIPDSTPTLKELACQAALTQCLGEYFQTALDEGDKPDYLPPWSVRENKWRAARYGLDATIITPYADEKLIPLRSGLRKLVHFLHPYSVKLGCEVELDFALELLDKGASYERQRRLAGYGGSGALHDVARSLMLETHRNAPRW